MWFGFPSKRPIFPFSWFPMTIPIGNGKLAQEGSALAQKRNWKKFLFLGQSVAGMARDRAVR
jgi:hypothetical protein